MSGELYGKLASEKLADENNECRQIAKTISEYGITDRQRLFLIYLLTLEVENAEKMQELSFAVKEIAGNETFVTSHIEVNHGS